jgi:hypothetical protein
MKRIVSVLSIVAVSLLVSAASVISAEDTFGKKEGKDVCLLVAMNCATSVDSYQQRIERLNKEIAKGTDVYTKDELRQLKIKLDNTIREMNALTTGS